MTTKQEHEALQRAQGLDNANGNDSKKRAAAIELMVGPADGKQTDRLVRLALAIAGIREAMR